MNEVTSRRANNCVELLTIDYIQVVFKYDDRLALRFTLSSRVEKKSTVEQTYTEVDQFPLALKKLRLLSLGKTDAGMVFHSLAVCIKEKKYRFLRYRGTFTNTH